MEKVDLTTWGGTKVRNRMKTLWPVAQNPQPAQADTEFGQYQQSLAKDIQNGNELIDEVRILSAEQRQIREDLLRRPF